MIAYYTIEILKEQLSDIRKHINENTIKSICGNQFYLQTFKNAFNV